MSAGQIQAIPNTARETEILIVECDECNDTCR